MSLAVAHFTQALPDSTTSGAFDLRVLEAEAERLASSAVWRTFQPLTENERTYAMIAATDSYEAWVISWPVGGFIELHDHGRSSGAVRVLRGQLDETSTSRWRPGGLVHRQLGVGDVISFGPDHLHELANGGDQLALTIHVYAPRLTTMTFYNEAAHGRKGA